MSTSRLGLEKSPFCKTDYTVSDHQVVENPDVYQCQRIFQAGCDSLICLGWFGNPAGVVVSEDDGGCIVFEGGFDHLSRVDACSVHGTVEHFVEADEAMPIVEEHRCEDFLFVLRELQFRISLGVFGAGEGFPLGGVPHSAFEDLKCLLDDLVFVVGHCCLLPGDESWLWGGEGKAERKALGAARSL